MKRYKHTGVKGVCTGGIRVEETTFVAVPSNAFNIDTATHLYLTKQAVPLPAVMGEIVDALECWGKALDSGWYHNSIEYLAYLVNNGFEFNRETLFHHIMQFKVDKMINEHSTDVPYETVMDEWELFAAQKYSHRQPFSCLCTTSFDYVAALLAQLDSLVHMMNVPAVSPVIAPAIISSDTFPSP